jgi:hypothetical protein
MNLITPTTTIQVHFNDLENPSEKTYACYIHSNLVCLLDLPTNKEEMQHIQSIARNKQAKESNEEPLFLYYFEVENRDFENPFTDSDIPEHFFKLGILNK